MSIWASGSPYERYVGRWSRLVAREFLAWLDVGEGRQWLDVGCGTGALSETILHQTAPAGLIGCDPSEGFLAHARAEIVDARVRFEEADARALPFDDRQFDAVVGGLMLNFVPETERALAEMTRVTRSGGTVAVYVWDYAGEMELMRHFWDAAGALDSEARALDEGVRFPICQPEPLARLFEGAGLEHVQTRAIDVPTVFRDFDDYWSPFLGAQGPAPGYAMSLDGPRRDALRDRIRAGLPAAEDGSIRLRARAWAVRGVRAVRD
jgi:SAM-dependent methyltransferase